MSVVLGIQVGEENALYAFPPDCDSSSADLLKTHRCHIFLFLYLLGTLDLLQEGVEFPGLSIQSATHSLVMVGSV